MRKKRPALLMSAFQVLKNNKTIGKKHKGLKRKKRKSDTVPSYVARDTDLSIDTNFDSRRKKKKVVQPSVSPDLELNGAVLEENQVDENVNNACSQEDIAQKSEHHVPCGNKRSERCIKWLIHPVTLTQFEQQFWEKRPLLIKNRGEKYYDKIFSCAEFDRILRENHVLFNTNIDVTTYTNGKRETHNPDGRALAAVIWDLYQNGHSIRLLNPQTFSKPIWRICSYLQEYFGSFVGANMYLTPPGSQGFAPHYDDIEAIVIQIEGQKLWKVYNPRSSSEVLPRISSENFAQDEIGEPDMQVELQPGDMLYFPRGFIHQARTPESAHSLHITLSTYQKNTWGDLLLKMMPQAIEAAMQENIEYRESLPKDYMNYMGSANTDKDCPERDAFIQKLTSLTRGLSKYFLADRATDMMAKEFIHSSLPPHLDPDESSRSIYGHGERWENGRVSNIVEMRPDTEIRLLRKRAVSLISEDGRLRLYHSFENSRVYQELEPQYVEIEWEYSPAVELLFNIHPKYVSVEQLPLRESTAQMDLATLLYDKGLIQTKVPLPPASDDEDESC